MAALSTPSDEMHGSPKTEEQFLSLCVEVATAAYGILGRGPILTKSQNLASSPPLLCSWGQMTCTHSICKIS